MIREYLSNKISPVGWGAGNAITYDTIAIPRGTGGKIVMIEYIIGNATSTITMTFSLLDPYGNVLYTKSSIVRNATTIDPANTTQGAAAIKFDPLLLDGGTIGWTPSGSSSTTVISGQARIFWEDDLK